MRPGRRVLYERTPEVSGRRIVSLPIDPMVTDPLFLGRALACLRQAQRFAEFEAGRRPVSLELLATVQHGDPHAIGYTLHFEVTPL